MGLNGNGSAARILVGVLITLIATILLGFGSWTVRATLAHDSRITKIESTICTKEDLLIETAQIQQKISELKLLIVEGNREQERD